MNNKDKLAWAKFLSGWIIISMSYFLFNKNDIIILIGTLIILTSGLDIQLVQNKSTIKLPVQKIKRKK